MENTINFTIKANETWKNSNEIYFNNKPSAAVISALKSLKMRWNSTKKCWYGFVAEQVIIDAINGKFKENPTENTTENSTENSTENQAEKLIIPDVIKIDDMYYPGWKGGNYHKWKDYDELKTLLKSDFKKAGLKVTIRCGRGMSSSMCFTISINKNSILSYEDYLKKQGASTENLSNISLNGYWFNYYDADGRIQNMHYSDFYNLDAENQKAMKENIIKCTYDVDVKGMENYNRITMEILTDEAAKKIKLMKKIVESYNHDQSNSMTDYFDRAIYDDYKVKLIH